MALRLLRTEAEPSVDRWEDWPEFKRILDIFASRHIMTSAQFDRLIEEVKARAGALAKVADTAFTADIYDSLFRAIRDGRTVRDWAPDAQAILDRYGAARGLEVYTGKRFSPSYIDNIYRTNQNSAHAAGNYFKSFSGTFSDAYPYWQRLAIHDDRARPEHLALHGRIFAKDDALASGYLPPYIGGEVQFNCRCTMRNVTEEEAARRGVLSGSDIPGLPLRDSRGRVVVSVDGAPALLGPAAVPGFDAVRALVPDALRELMSSGAGSEAAMALEALGAPAQPRDEHGRFASKGMLAATRGDGGALVAHDGAPLPPHIQALRVPPAWTGVHYHPDPEADLQVVGKDSKGRAQYVYSQRFSDAQSQAKFARIEEALPKLPAMVEQNAHGLTASNEKVRQNAECLHVVMTTGIRPGSEADTGAKKQAYGATTLLKEHVSVGQDGAVRLRFTGKKGVDLDIPVHDERAAAILKDRASAAEPGKQLWPHVSETTLGARSHEMDGGGLKTKDFRTLRGTSVAYDAAARIEPPRTEKEYHQRVKEVALHVSRALGNTPSVALESYISPAVFHAWRKGALR